MDCTRDAGLPIPPPPPPEKAAIVSDLRQQTPQQQLFLFCEVERNKGFHCGGKGKVVREMEMGGGGRGGGRGVHFKRNLVPSVGIVLRTTLEVRFLSGVFKHYGLDIWTIQLKLVSLSRHTAMVLFHTLVPFS